MSWRNILASGKYFRAFLFKVSQLNSSRSTKALVEKPAISRPKAMPPDPAKSSMEFSRSAEDRCATRRGGISSTKNFLSAIKNHISPKTNPHECVKHGFGHIGDEDQGR